MKRERVGMTFSQKLAFPSLALLSASSAFAGVLTVAPEFDTSDVTLIAGAVIAALAVIWGVKKAISLVSRA